MILSQKGICKLPLIDEERLLGETRNLENNLEVLDWMDFFSEAGIIIETANLLLLIILRDMKHREMWRMLIRFS